MPKTRQEIHELIVKDVERQYQSLLENVPRLGKLMLRLKSENFLSIPIEEGFNELAECIGLIHDVQQLDRTLGMWNAADEIWSDDT